ncbi:MAG: hypothetical protein ACKPKO_23335, partial [Candidatus Fonsibacter sp.]
GLVEEIDVEKLAVDKPMPFINYAEKPDQSDVMIKHEWLKEANDALFDALQRDFAAERNAACSPASASQLQQQDSEECHGPATLLRGKVIEFLHNEAPRLLPPVTSLARHLTKKSGHLWSAWSMMVC